MNFLSKHLFLCVLLAMVWLNCLSQCPTYATLGKEIGNINTNTTLSYYHKLEALYALKEGADKCRLVNDSAYALLLRSIGNDEYLANNNYFLAVALTSQAVTLNNALHNRGSQHLAALCYYSIGYYHQNAKMYRQAVAYYDSAAAYSNRAADIKTLRIPSRQNKAYLLFFLGDYEKSVEECILGMNDAVGTKDRLQYLVFLNIKAQSLCFENNIPQAQADAQQAIQLSAAFKDSFELAAALKTCGFIAEKKGEDSVAKAFFTKAVAIRRRIGDAAAIAGDYNDLGNFFIGVKNYGEAKKNYLQTIFFARQMDDAVQRSSQLALAYSNLGDNSFEHNKLEEAAQYYTSAFRYLNIQLPDYLFANPAEAQLRMVEHKELVYNLLTQKTSFLLKLYLQHKDAKYLDACLQTAMLTDSVITHARHEQTGESSKLVWRNNTRGFFADAMEACYLAGNATLAFHFMEKSRAVLLNDKLNELGAAARLPPADAAKEERLQTKVIEAEQQLSQLDPSTQEYAQQQFQYLNAKVELERFIQTLEKKFPVYYQYKYADSVSSLAALQQYLANNRQSFVHYFLDDTVMYVLGITPNYTGFIKVTSKDFDIRQLPAFLSLCSDKEKLNNSYRSFASLSNDIYNKLFRPLQLPYGNIAVCTDNFLIPFEALCTDINGKNFLLYHYCFSYVYSASLLLKPLVNNTAATGNFIGFAPVAFAQNLQLVPLKASAAALSQSAGFYNQPTLFTEADATRGNFFRNASSYAVITVFSHAKADTSGQEPVLYMQDAAIHLSELQLLQKTSAQFVLLSACQTNIGKTATGEGIYSLARGFASVGIPAIAATMWKADEQTVYSISSKFNEYLAAGMNKSEALQKAKLWFIQNDAHNEHALPYYWANMVLIGNTQPIHLVKESPRTWLWAGVVGLGAVVILIIVSKQISSKQHAKKHARKIKNEHLVRI